MKQKCNIFLIIRKEPRSVKSDAAYNRERLILYRFGNLVRPINGSGFYFGFNVIQGNPPNTWIENGVPRMEPDQDIIFIDCINNKKYLYVTDILVRLQARSPYSTRVALPCIFLVNSFIHILIKFTINIPFFSVVFWNTFQATKHPYFAPTSNNASKLLVC